jgi:hypothetical protein
MRYIIQYQAKVVENLILQGRYLTKPCKKRKPARERCSGGKRGRSHGDMTVHELFGAQGDRQEVKK